MRHLLLLCLPTLTFALLGVELEGTVHSNVVSSKAYPQGFEEHLISNKERRMFGVEDESLKLFIEKINGKKPDDVYTTNKTPFGDLHKRYGWKQLSVKVQALSDNYFVDFSSDTVRMSKTKYENANSRPKETVVYEKKYFTNYIYSNWTREAGINDLKTKIKFNFNVDDHSLNFERTIRFGYYRIYVDKRYFEKNATIRLEPAQVVTAELEATKGIITAEIPYQISLTGDVIAKYNESYNDKYFHIFDINQLINAGNITETKKVYQTLRYEVLYDAKLLVCEIDGSVLKSFPSEVDVNKDVKKATTSKHNDGTEGAKGTNEDFDADNEEEEEKSEENKET